MVWEDQSVACVGDGGGVHLEIVVEKHSRGGLRRVTSSLCSFDAFSCAGSHHESEGPDWIVDAVARGWECGQSIRPK